MYSEQSQYMLRLDNDDFSSGKRIKDRSLRNVCLLVKIHRSAHKWRAFIYLFFYLLNR